MSQLKDLLRQKHAHVINHGGRFAFSLPYTPEILKEIEEMGEDFKSKYLFTVADIPGMPNRQVCFNLKR